MPASVICILFLFGSQAIRLHQWKKEAATNPASTVAAAAEPDLGSTAAEGAAAETADPVKDTVKAEEKMKKEVEVMYGTFDVTKASAFWIGLSIWGFGPPFPLPAVADATRKHLVSLQNTLVDAVQNKTFPEEGIVTPRLFAGEDEAACIWEPLDPKPWKTWKGAAKDVVGLSAIALMVVREASRHDYLEFLMTKYLPEIEDKKKRGYNDGGERNEFVDEFYLVLETKVFYRGYSVFAFVDRTKDDNRVAHGKWFGEKVVDMFAKGMVKALDVLKGPIATS